MNITLRIVLLVCAVCAFAYMLRKIRKSEVKIGDSTFWFLFGLSLVLFAAFPQIAYFFSDLLSVDSPSNFVFLYVIAILLIREFITTTELSRTRSKLAFLTQEIALKAAEDEGTAGAPSASSALSEAAKRLGDDDCASRRTDDAHLESRDADGQPREEEEASCRSSQATT